MIGGWAYTLGALELSGVLIAAGLCGTTLRRRILPGWSGAPGLLADLVLGLATLLLAAELLGTVGLFTPLALTAVIAATATGLRRFLTSSPGAGIEQADAAREDEAAPFSMAATITALTVSAIVVAHWSIGTQLALRAGITGFDSNWYHLPLTANFVQSGSTIGFPALAPRYLAWFYPANGELLSAVAVAPFHRDFLLPLANIGWLLGTLGAAWCIGRPYGRGPWTLLAAAVVLDSGVLADQAGDARNDIAGLFFLLAAVAFLVNSRAPGSRARPELGALAIAGLAAGLAAGVKLTMLGPAAGLALSVVLTGAGSRRKEALAFGGPLLAGCGFWYLRNLIATGNPLPWYRSLGPIGLDGPHQGVGGRSPGSIVHYLTDQGVWSRWFLPGLEHRLGSLWPLVLAAVATGLLFCVITRGDRFLRAAALAGLVAIPLYLFNGTSAEGPPGMPVGFVSSLRHLAPTLLLGLVVLPLAPSLRRGRRSAAVFGALLVAFPFVDASARPWAGDLTGVAALVGAGALCAALLLCLLVPSASRRWSLAATGMAAAIAVVLVWPLQRSYTERRYEDGAFRSSGLGEAYEMLGRLHEQAIATTLTLQYPLFGADLSNRVGYLGRPGEDSAFRPLRDCASFRRALSAERYRYLLTSSDDGVRAGGWMAGRQVRVVLRRGHVVVYELLGPLSSAACPDSGNRAAPDPPRPG